MSLKYFEKNDRTCCTELHFGRAFLQKWWPKWRKTFHFHFHFHFRFWGLQGGCVPLPLGKFCICKLFTHNFRPFFSLNLQKYVISGGPLWPPEIYNFWWSQGAAVLFIRECVFLGNHKCTTFLSKCLRMWLQGGGAPLPKKIILQAKYA